MDSVLLIAVAVIMLCVLFNKLSGRLGVPMLLAFIVLGMLLGSDGILFKIQFDDFNVTETLCSVAMIFIMFYGGFGTKWSAARPVAANAIVLSSVGTVATAGLVGLFCWQILKMPVLESFLFGSVISSTDAASVFAILRSKKRGLKSGTDSLLEIESGSNDPFSYMLTVIMLSLMNGNASGGKVAYMLFAQVVYGAIGGVAVAVFALFVFKKFKLPSGGFDAVFMVAVALAAYAVPSYIGGNGFLSAYITGIILGNRRIPGKQSLVNFFDGVTGFMQMLLFFMLGLLSYPSQLIHVALPALAIALFLTFIARPIAVFLIMTPFGCGFKKQLLVSWAGMRGAASIVFAIMAMVDPATTDKDIFHMVFFIVLFSILIQGTLLPFVAKKLDMIDSDADVMKTFTDYSDEVPVQFLHIKLRSPHPWVGKCVKDVVLPPESLFVLLIRDGVKSAPDGNTVLSDGDVLILSGRAAKNTDCAALFEQTVEKGDGMVGKMLSVLPSDGLLVVMIKRGDSVVIPRGNTVLHPGDVLVMMNKNEMQAANV